MADSVYKQVRDRLKTDLLAAPASLRKVYDSDTPDSRIFPHAVLMIEAGERSEEGQMFTRDTYNYPCIILIRGGTPEAVRKLCEIVQVLWHNGTRLAALGVLNAQMKPAGVYVPHNDNTGKTKQPVTGIVSFDLEIRYNY